MSILAKRLATLFASACVSALACYLFIRFIAFDGNDGLDFPRTLLLTFSSFWLAYGVFSSSLGLVQRPTTVPRLPDGEPLTARVAILVPIYNEDPVSTFSRVAAMDASLSTLGAQQQFHFAILSDTRDDAVADEEAVWFAQLITQRGAQGRMFYRRRPINTGRKAGNIEDFIRRSGAAYDLALILDADSLLEAATIIEMARRMQADPKLGLLQTLPRIIHARSFFGRTMQFAASYFSPVFARGTASLQGREGPYWGHNAMVRLPAFAASCGLPELTGKPPFGGHVLSHDYVEAALLSRAGWSVRLDTDLLGSFEEGPENLIEYAKRDRRWCQGNLQHIRIVFAPGLRWWNRFTLFQGIMAYVASPLWLLFLLTSIAAAALTRPDISYFTDRLVPFYRPESTTWAGLTLLWGVFVLLVLPKILIVLRGTLTGDNRNFGGTLRVVATTMVEIIFSSLVAPIMLMLQSRAVFQVVLGLDGGWPATVRSEGRVGFAEAFRASYWIVLTGLLAQTMAILFAPAIAPWIVPVAAPMLLAPAVIALSSRSRSKAPPLLFTTPTERVPSLVMLERQTVLETWSGIEDISPPVPLLPAKEILTHVDI